MGQLVVVTPPTTEPITLAEVAAHCRIDETNQEPAPSAPTVALVSPAAPGNVDNGAHRYLVTYVTADGETQAGVASAVVTVADKTVNGKVLVSGIPLGGASVTARKLYRTLAGGSTYFLLATISDNTTTTYTDNIADASLGVGAPTTNTTGDPLLNMLIVAARQHVEPHLKRRLITQTLDLYLDCFPGWTLRLPVPIQSVTAITYFDSNGVEQTLAADQYLVDSTTEPARITPAFGLVWPVTQYRNNAVKVRFVAGYGAASAVPQCVKNWMLIRIKTLWDQRDQNVKQLGMPTFEPDFVDSLLDSEMVRSYS
jgi:uncharacterized phiE125 gp8 family phage protein